MKALRAIVEKDYSEMEAVTTMTSRKSATSVCGVVAQTMRTVEYWKPAVGDFVEGCVSESSMAPQMRALMDQLSSTEAMDFPMWKQSCKKLASWREALKAGRTAEVENALLESLCADIKNRVVVHSQCSADTLAAAIAKAKELLQKAEALQEAFGDAVPEQLTQVADDLRAELSELDCQRRLQAACETMASEASAYDSKLFALDSAKGLATLLTQDQRATMTAALQAHRESLDNLWQTLRPDSDDAVPRKASEISPLVQVSEVILAAQDLIQDVGQVKAATAVAAAVKVWHAHLQCLDYGHKGADGSHRLATLKEALTRWQGLLSGTFPMWPNFVPAEEASQAVDPRLHLPFSELLKASAENFLSKLSEEEGAQIVGSLESEVAALEAVAGCGSTPGSTWKESLPDTASFQEVADSASKYLLQRVNGVAGPLSKCKKALQSYQAFLQRTGSASRTPLATRANDAIALAQASIAEAVIVGKLHSMKGDVAMREMQKHIATVGKQGVRIELVHAVLWKRAVAVAKGT